MIDASFLSSFWAFKNVLLSVFCFLFGIFCFPPKEGFIKRHGLLRSFGATIDKDAYINPSCKVFMPWNLKCGRACIGPNTNIYNKAPITIGDDSVISQGSFLCTAGHDISSMMLPLTTTPITIGNKVWVAADCFIGPGVTMHDGAVLGARGCLFKDAEKLGVYGGNPAKLLKIRELKEAAL